MRSFPPRTCQRSSPHPARREGLQQRDRTELLGREAPERRHHLPDVPAGRRPVRRRAVHVEPLRRGHLVELAGRAGRRDRVVAADAPRLPPHPRHQPGEILLECAPRHPRAPEGQQRMPGGRSPRGPAVVEREAELGDQAADGVMAGVDELAAVLGDLSATQVARRPAPPAEPLARLEHGRRDAVLAQPVRARQSRVPPPTIATGATSRGDEPASRGTTAAHASPPAPARNARRVVPSLGSGKARAVLCDRGNELHDAVDQRLLVRLERPC